MIGDIVLVKLSGTACPAIVLEGDAGVLTLYAFRANGPQKYTSVHHGFGEGQWYQRSETPPADPSTPGFGS